MDGKQNSLTQSAALPLMSEGAGASAPAPGLLTIDQPYARMYVEGVAERYQSAALLKKAYVKGVPKTGDIHRTTPYRQALWDGYYAVKDQIGEWVEEAVKKGCLLHLVPA